MIFKLLDRSYEMTYSGRVVPIAVFGRLVPCVADSLCTEEPAGALLRAEGVDLQHKNTFQNYFNGWQETGKECRRTYGAQTTPYQVIKQV